jgi:dienelactone hydrolase
MGAQTLDRIRQQAPTWQRRQTTKEATTARPPVAFWSILEAHMTVVSYPLLWIALSYALSHVTAFTAWRGTLGASRHGRSMAAADDWQALDPESLVSAPCLIEQTLCQASGTQARLAKDKDYATAVLDAWKDDEQADWEAVYKPVVYTAAAGDGATLHGYCIRRHLPAADEEALPGIIFFHTGAGPHDLFLLYKAVALVNTLPCVVLMADVLSDASGWSWSADRTRYTAARKEVLAADVDGVRPLLQQRIRAALDFLAQDAGVDRYAVLGWCLGGHSVLEISRMENVEAVRAMATFHGVFDGLPPPPPVDAETTAAQPEVLICHGTEDPFVSSTALEQALATLQARRYRTSLLQLPARHGFTNPAQDFNENPAFAFAPEAAAKAWKQATNLLQRTLGSS